MATVSCLTTPPVSWLPWPEHALDTDMLVFRCSVNSPLATPPYQWLTSAEWQRADRFLQPLDRQRFVLGRSLWRKLAGHVSGQHPEQITLVIGPHGKPNWPNEYGWCVNLAHAGNWVVLVLAKTAVGIDVEHVQPGFDYKSLINTVFSRQEQAYIDQHAEPLHAFYDLWTRKEALVKATGLGLSDHLAQLPVLTGTHALADDTLGDNGPFTVASFWVDAQHRAAVAWAGPLPTSHSPVTCYTV